MPSGGEGSIGRHASQPFTKNSWSDEQTTAVTCVKIAGLDRWISEYGWEKQA